MKLRLFLVLAVLAGLLTGCVEKRTPSTTGAGETDTTVQPAASTLNLWCFQAGKADAFLLWNESGTVLIDTGESGFGKEILKKLQELGIQRLDYLIITHFDKDHVGGAKKILSEIPVGVVLQSNCPKTGAESYEKYLNALKDCALEPFTVRQSMDVILGETYLTVDPPARASYDRDESNNSSLIVSVTHGQNRMLFCGDAGDLRLTEFLKSEPGNYALVKLPHHGQYQSTLRELLAETEPRYAIISSSEEEPEDAETLTLLEDRGVTPLLTRKGPIQITCGPAGLTVEGGS